MYLLMRKFLRKITGITLAFTLIFSQVPVANAIYSPYITSEISLVKANIIQARQVHGVFNFGDLLRERSDFINIGLYSYFFESVGRTIANGLVDGFLDGFALFFGINPKDGKLITTCLRDDVWELQALQEEVLNELFKTALLGDFDLSTRLSNDYDLLEEIINGNKDKKAKRLRRTVNGQEVELETEGLQTDYELTASWFPPGTQNYYINCPYGEFTQAFQQLVNSVQTLGGFTRPYTGSLKEAAIQNAKRRAEQWIAANQLTLTLGGEAGSNPKSLVRGPGLDGLSGDLRTEWEYIKEYGDLVFVSPFRDFESRSPEVADVVDFYEKAQKSKTLAVGQAQNALRYRLTLQDTGEENLKALDQALFEINQEIQRAFTTNSSPANAKTFCEQIRTVARTQCKNHIDVIPACK